MPSFTVEDAKCTLIHDTAKRCAQSLQAHPRGDVVDVAASHELVPIDSRVARVVSDDLDNITNGLDDSVDLQGLSLTLKRTAILGVRITIQAERVLARQVRRANLERCRVCRVGSLPSPLHDIVCQRLHFRLEPKTGRLEALAGSRSPQKLSHTAARNSKAVSPSSGQLEGGVRHAGSSIEALATVFVM